MAPPQPARPAGPRLFEFTHVDVERNGVMILRDVSAAVPDVGITVLIGPSGAGKTSLLRLCNRLDAPTGGSVRFRGADVATVDPLWLRRRAGMVFQQPVLFGGTVRDNLSVALPNADDERYARALRDAALDPAVLGRPAAALSGGEAQRACLARTLVTDPDVLLLDEPTAALDSGPKMAFERLALQLAAAGMPMVWVTHDPAQLRRVADHVLAVVAGRLVYCGEPDGLPHVAALRQLLREGDA